MANLSTVEKTSRAFFAGRFALELGDGAKGSSVDLVFSIDGGHFKSEAIGEKVGADGIETRYPGRQKFDSITVQIGTAISPEFWDWIQKSIDNNYTRKNGAIVAYDFDGKERTRRNFFDALIEEVQFPALDAKAKQPAFLTVKIAPERMEWAKASGGSAPPADVRKQKLWIPANFRFRIDGFGDTQRWVQKVDQLAVKQNIIMNPIGKELYVRKEVGRIDYPNIVFTIPETYGQPFMDYWKLFVGQGEHLSSNEHTATIEYLSSDLTQVLMTLNFQGVGITAVDFDKHEAGTDAIRMYKVQCYTEKMKLTRGAGNK